MAYDKNTDYQSLIDKAVANGDYAAAAKYEQQRNEKIADLNASGANTYGAAATSNYSGYLNSGYTPLNATSSAGVDRQKYEQEVQNQQAYIAANPTAAQAMTAQEKQEKYGGITDPIWSTGVYTTDKEGAMAAAQQWGLDVTPTDYAGKSGYYYVPDVKDQRTVQQGASGADEGLMTNQDYAIIQSLKSDYAAAQEKYQAAMAAGDAALAAQYQQAMDTAHLEAERIRAGYGYSGGSDGSMYITQGKLGVGESSGGSSAGGSYSSYGSGGLTVPDGGNLTGYVNDYSSYLEEMYAAQKAAALAQLKNAYEQNINAIDRAGEGIDTAYQDARNQTAGASDLAGRNFNEYAAANGLNNGTAGQAELARNVTLQNDMNTLNSEEAQAISDLELQRANAETEYNNAIAQAEAEGNYQLAAALYQEKVRYDNAMISAIQQEYENAITNYQLQYQAQRDSVSDSQWAQSFAFQQQQYADSLALQQQQYAFQQQQYADSLSQSQNSTLASYGETYLQMGIMPSDAMLEAMGITQADAQAYISAMNSAAKAVSGTGSSSSSSGSSGSSGSTMTLTTAKQAASNGVFNDQVLAVLRKNGYTDDMLEAIYGYAPSTSSTDSTGINIGTGTGSGKNLSYREQIYGTEIDNVYSKVRSMVGQGKSADSIAAYLDTLSSSALTDAGLDYILLSFNIGNYRTGG